MTQLTPIPTPLRRRLEILRLRLLPFVGFLVCVLIVSSVWHRRVGVATGVGRAQLEVREARAPMDRKLMDLPGETGWHELFAHVEKDQLIARLDDEKTTKAIDVASLEIKKLGKDYEAVTEQIKLDLFGRDDAVRRIIEQRERELRLLDLRLELFKNEVELRGNQALLESQEEELALIRGAHAEGAVARVDRIQLKGERDQTLALIRQSQATKQEIREQLDEAEKAKEEFATLDFGIDARIEPLLAPIDAQIEIQQATVDLLQVELDDLEIRSPIAGLISAIHFRPGQSVLPGDPIVTISSVESNRIIFYVRQGMNVDPVVNQPVRIRQRRRGARRVDSRIVDIGPGYELVPLELRSDPMMNELGHPILIEIPEELALRPGELVDVEFRH